MSESWQQDCLQDKKVKRNFKMIILHGLQIENSNKSLLLEKKRVKIWVADRIR
jgi:hypothetical protein